MAKKTAKPKSRSPTKPNTPQARPGLRLRQAFTCTACGYVTLGRARAGDRHSGCAGVWKALGEPRGT